jgi:hypothetical protein
LTDVGHKERSIENEIKLLGYRVSEIAQFRFDRRRNRALIVIQLTIGHDAATEASEKNDFDRPPPN